MKKLVTFILGMSAMFSVAGCNNPAGTGGHSYNFKYPTADRAVWWEMHENRIREEPYISQREGYLYINVNLYKELYPYVLSIQKTQETAPEGAALMKGYVTAIWKLAV